MHHAWSRSLDDIANYNASWRQMKQCNSGEWMWPGSILLSLAKAKVLVMMYVSNFFLMIVDDILSMLIQLAYMQVVP